jgi:hypothetical protein
MKKKFSSYTRMFYERNGREKFYQDHSSIKDRENIKIKGLTSDLLFFHHENDETFTGQSYINTFEAEMVLNLARFLTWNNYSPNQITIITMYSA